MYIGRWQVSARRIQYASEIRWLAANTRITGYGGFSSTRNTGIRIQYDHLRLRQRQGLLGGFTPGYCEVKFGLDPNPHFGGGSQHFF